MENQSICGLELIRTALLACAPADVDPAPTQRWRNVFSCCRVQVAAAAKRPAALTFCWRRCASRYGFLVDFGCMDTPELNGYVIAVLLFECGFATGLFWQRYSIRQGFALVPYCFIDWSDDDNINLDMMVDNTIICL
jgi:hypothetical protein